MLRVVCAFDPDTGAELARLSSTIQPNMPQLSDDRMVHEGRAELVRLHSLTKADADRARYEVREDHEDDACGALTIQEKHDAAS